MIKYFMLIIFITILLINCTKENKYEEYKNYLNNFELKYPDIYNENFFNGINMDFDNIKHKNINLLKITKLDDSFFSFLFEDDTYNLFWVELGENIDYYQITINKNDNEIYASKFIENTIDNYFNILDEELYEYEKLKYIVPEEKKDYLYYCVFGAYVNQTIFSEGYKYPNYNVYFLCIDRIIEKIIIEMVFPPA